MSHLSPVQKKEFFIDFSTYFHEPFVCGKGVPKVLHIGPYNSKGGMSSVMKILHDFPPQGWTSDIISTHDERSIFHNIFRFFSSKKKCHRQFKSENRPDLVHVHCASDWSWKRKAKFIQLATRYSIP